MTGVLDRRQVLMGVPAVVGGGLLLPRLARADAGLVTTVVSIAVPLLAELFFDDLFDYVEDLFKDDDFSPGAVLPQGEIPTPHHRNIDSTLKTSFVTNGAQRRYESPILAMDKGLQSPMQLGPRMGTKGKPNPGWSIVGGGPSGNESFHVQERWLKWWMDKDNCGRIIAGDSEYGLCPHEGCNIMLASMRFIRQRKEELLAVVPTKYRKTDDFKRHREHAPPAVECPDFDLGEVDCLESKPTK